MAKQSNGYRGVKNKNNNNRFRTQKTALKARPNKGTKKIIKKSQNTIKLQDARQKIILKKRKKVVDARDVLAKMAKTQDARNKIDKLRNGVSRPAASNTNVKVIGTNILKKTDRNGKISLVTTNKSKPNSTTNINFAIKKELGLITSPNSNTKKANYAFKRNIQRAKTATQPIRKTIINDFGYASHQLKPAGRAYDPSAYRWTRPELRSDPQVIEETRQAMREVMREEMMANKSTWSGYYAPKSQMPTSYIDIDAVDEEMPMAPRIALQGSQRISNVHSRLDSYQPEPESHGIFSQTKTKVVIPAGHRIVVSNLQPTVTQDDIKELFEDIGELLAARLVRPGVAEVIYKQLRDAQKAVDTYHNRQLDGHPMKCLLVNKRPTVPTTSAATVRPTVSDGTLGIRKATLVQPGPAKLVPDLNTIHKVLFQRK